MYSSLANASALLANCADWKLFFPYMEMIARENQGDGKGKMIFPQLVFEISGLEPTKEYQLWLSLERHDNERYTFDKKNKKWGVSEVRRPRKSHEYKQIEHPTGAQTGAKWMESPIFFEKVRITNQEKNAGIENMILVTPQHKYNAVITMRDVLNPRDEKRIVVPYAQFIAVTGYYCKEMGRWKAQHNLCVPNDIRAMGVKNESRRGKRKAADETLDVPVAKRVPLGEKKVQQVEAGQNASAPHDVPLNQYPNQYGGNYDYQWANYNYNYYYHYHYPTPPMHYNFVPNQNGFPPAYFNPFM